MTRNKSNVDWLWIGLIGCGWALLIASWTADIPGLDPLLLQVLAAALAAALFVWAAVRTIRRNWGKGRQPGRPRR